MKSETPFCKARCMFEIREATIREVCKRNAIFSKRFFYLNDLHEKVMKAKAIPGGHSRAARDRWSSRRLSPALLFSRFSIRTAFSMGFMDAPPSAPDPAENEDEDCWGWQSGLGR